MQDFNNSKGFYMKKDDLITRCKLLKGERDESIFTILIGIVVKLGAGRHGILSVAWFHD